MLYDRSRYEYRGKFPVQKKSDPLSSRISQPGGWPNLDEEILLAGIVRFLPFIIRQCQRTLLPGSK
jgi:hypothetical protein